MFTNNLPLSLPKGSVRAIIALAVVGVSLALFYKDGTVPSELLTLLGAVTGFYFAGRQATNGS